MDSIKIAIEQESIDDGPLFVSVYINGNDMPKILDVETFFALKGLHGHVPLFTCGCGDFGCGGYYVNVSSTEVGLLLQNSYHRFSHLLQKEFEYSLDWQKIRGIAEEILVYLQKIREHNPQAYVTTGHGGENLLKRIDTYRKSPLLNS